MRLRSKQTTRHGFLIGDPFTPYPVHPVYPVENKEKMGTERERFLGLLDAMKLEYSYLEDEDVEVEKKW